MSWLGDMFTAIKRVLPTSTDPNFAASAQFYTPGQPVWTDKDYRTFVRSGYRKNPTIYTCINKISGAAAGIRWKLYTDQDLKRTIDKHALLDLWQKPNPNASGSAAFIETVFGYWHMAGNSYVWAFRPSPGAPPLALWPLRPDMVKAVASDSGIDSYVYGYGSPNPRIYDKADIAHIKFPGYDDNVYGLSPTEVASYLADQQNEAMAWNTALMQNAGRPASVFFSKTFLSVEQRNQIKDELRRRYSGKRNAGMPMVLEADMDWKNMSLSPMELDWLKSRELNTRDIAAIYDIAPELIGDSAGKTFANVAEARAALYLENVLPKLDRFRDYLNSWLTPMYEDLAKSGAVLSYDKDDIEALAEVYQKAETAKEDRAIKLWNASIATLNEARDRVGLEKVDGGDCIKVGAVLVSLDSLEVYADQSLTEPAGPPMPVAEPLNIAPPASSGQPALPAPKQPAGASQPTAKQPAPASAGKKTMDKNGVYQPDDLNQQLAALEAKGITYVTWLTSPGSCDVCMSNDMVTRKVGDPFPSGHILPEVHPNCECQVVDANRLEAAKRRLYEGYKVHEENSENGRGSGFMVVNPANYARLFASDGFNLQLRSMRLQGPARIQTRRPYTVLVPRDIANTAPDAGALTMIVEADHTASKSLYRAFMDRYE